MQGDNFMKDHRELLTRQTICEKLNWESKRSIGLSALILFFGLIFFGMINLVWSMALPANAGILKFIPLLLYLPVFVACVVSFVRALIRMSKVSRGEFTVTEETLTEIRDNEFSLIQLILYGGKHTLLGDKSHLRHVFKFESGKSFIANAGDYNNTRLRTAAEFSLPGDHFFLVFYNDSPDKIILLFSSKTYNYQDNQ
jgi:hypothetical protein